MGYSAGSVLLADRGAAGGVAVGPSRSAGAPSMAAALPRSSRPLAVVAPSPRVVALAGGTGAAKFLRGLIRVIEPARITVIVNTADDVERHGLLVSPDIDSVVYGLADVHDEERGWGRRDETWQALAMLDRLGDETWFQLGDRDLG